MIDDQMHDLFRVKNRVLSCKIANDRVHAADIVDQYNKGIRTTIVVHPSTSIAEIRSIVAQIADGLVMEMVSGVRGS